MVGGNQVFNRFDVPQLRGINKTAPYFHDHRATTLEDVVRHYQSFFAFINRGSRIPAAAHRGRGHRADRPVREESAMTARGKPRAAPVAPPTRWLCDVFTGDKEIRRSGAIRSEASLVS